MHTKSSTFLARLTRNKWLGRTRFANRDHFAIIACFTLVFVPLNQTMLHKDQTPFLDNWTNIRPIEVARVPLEHLSILKLRAFSHSFADAERILGSAVIVKDSSESGSKKLCYCSANVKDKTRLVLYAGASGGWEYITGFALLPADSALEQCKNSTRSKVVSKTILTASGLRLGMTRTQFEAAIGYPPSDVANGRVFYLFHAVSKRASTGTTKGATRSPKQPSQELDYSCFIEGRFSNGVLVALSVSATVTA
ncbi:MAG: hypothetical protein AABO41_23250 [Acidobacteriota bacterium]